MIIFFIFIYLLYLNVRKCAQKYELFLNGEAKCTQLQSFFGEQRKSMYFCGKFVNLNNVKMSHLYNI